MITFHPQELPVANSMIRAAAATESRPHDRHSVFAKYMYLWMAFNNIYTTIAFTQGQHAETIIGSDGAIDSVRNGSVQIPRVRTIGERKQLKAAFAEIDDDLHHRLILHPSTKFFAYRRPHWHGIRLSMDAKGQRINGVINVNYTTEPHYPVWSPIDIPGYEKYITDPQDSSARMLLAWQIVELLYTVRCNLMHGGKRADDAVDLEVVERALPLLKLIVEAFIPDARRRDLMP